MNKDQKKAYNWLVKHVAKETKFPELMIDKVLSSIADLEWNFENTEYDLIGIELYETLSALGQVRHKKHLEDFNAKLNKNKTNRKAR